MRRGIAKPTVGFRKDASAREHVPKMSLFGLLATKSRPRQKGFIYWKTSRRLVVKMMALWKGEKHVKSVKASRCIGQDDVSNA